MCAMTALVTIARDAAGSISAISTLPDEILLQILWYLDIPELLTMTRVGAYIGLFPETRNLD